MRGQSLLRHIMAELLIGKVDFYTSRLYNNAEKRGEAMRRLHAAGLNSYEIARLVRRDHTTVLYWIRPGVRQRRKRAMTIYNRSRNGRKQEGRAQGQREA